MSLSNTPKLYEIVLDYTPEIIVSSFSPLSMEIDSASTISVIGESLDRVTTISWNGISLDFTAPTSELISISIENLPMAGQFPLYFESPTLNIYSAENLTVYISQFGNPPTLNQRLRTGKFLSRLGFIKFSSK